MQSIKKKIPLSILPEVSKILVRHQDIIQIRDSQYFMIDIREKGNHSEFYFNVGYAGPDGNHEIYRKPGNMDLASEKRYFLPVAQIPMSLENWTEFLRGYSDTVTIFDDPIIENYTNEIYFDLKFDDPDADLIPFKLSEQIYLDQYLSKVKSSLIPYKHNVSAEEKVEIDEIELECNRLQKELTKLPKNQVLKKLSHIFAKARRFSLSLLKELIQDVKKEIFKSVAKGILESGSGSFWDLLT